MTKQVLSVGQCGPDHYALSRFIESQFDARVVPANVTEDALETLAAGSIDLVLVNRKLDADYSDGMEVLRAIKQKYPELPVMIITNYAEHQEAAVKEGAHYGFGKLEYNKPQTLERLRGVLG